MSPVAAVWLTDMFLVLVGHQCKCTAKRNEVNQVLDSLNLVSRFHAFLGLVCLWDFLIKKHGENHQPYLMRAYNCVLVGLMS